MMKYNEYYNKNMNFKQLTCDLEKQGYICELSKDGDYMSVYYLLLFGLCRNSFDRI